MGEFNVNKSDGSLEQTAGMPETYPATQVMMSDGVTSVEDALNGLQYENPSSKISATLESGLTKDYFIIRTLGNLMVAQVRVLWNTPSTAETKIATLNGFTHISAYLTGVVLADNTTQIGNFILSGNQLYIKLTTTISSSTKICMTIIGFNT